MADSSFEIKITTPAELSGALAVEASLGRQIGQAKAAGKDFSALVTQQVAAKKLIDEYTAAKAKEAAVSAAAAAAAQQAAAAVATAEEQKIAESKRWQAIMAEEASAAKTTAAAEIARLEAVASMASKTKIDSAGAGRLSQYGVTATDVAQMNALSGAQNVAAQSAEKLALKQGQVRKIARAISDLVPGLGIGFQAMFSGVGAAIAVVAMAAKALKDFLDDLNAKLDAFGEEAAKPASNKMEILRQSIVSAAVASTEFKLRLADAARGEQTLAEKTTLAIDKLKEQNQRSEELDSAAKGLDLAKLETLHTAGLMSTIQYEAAKYAVEEEYARRKHVKQEKEMADEIAMRENSVAQANADQKKLEKDATKKQADFEAKSVVAETKSAAVQKTLADRLEAQKQLTEFEKSLWKKEKGLFESLGTTVNPDTLMRLKSNPGLLTTPAHYALRQYVNSGGINLGEVLGTENITTRFKDWQDRKRAVTTAITLENNAPAAAGKAKSDLANSEDEMKRAQDKAIKNREFITENTKKDGVIDQAYDKLDALTKENLDTEKIDRQSHHVSLFGSVAGKVNELSGKEDMSWRDYQDLRYGRYMLSGNPNFNPLPTTPAPAIAPTPINMPSPNGSGDKIVDSFLRYADALAARIDGRLNNHDDQINRINSQFSNRP
jgi:hypothetical protein